MQIELLEKEIGLLEEKVELLKKIEELQRYTPNNMWYFPGYIQPQPYPYIPYIPYNPCGTPSYTQDYSRGGTG